jgi:hypothetical protein
MELRPIAPEAARAFVARCEGAETPPALYACALADAGGVRAVAVVCVVEDGAVDGVPALEIACIATEGDARGMALSQLYGAARRVAYGLGYRRLYRVPVRDGELGALRGAGWRGPGATDAGRWQAPPP